EIFISLRGQKQLNSFAYGFDIWVRFTCQDIVKLPLNLAGLVFGRSPILFLRGPSALHALIGGLHPGVGFSVPTTANNICFKPDGAVAALIKFVVLMFAGLSVSAVQR